MAGRLWAWRVAVGGFVAGFALMGCDKAEPGRAASTGEPAAPVAAIPGPGTAVETPVRYKLAFNEVAIAQAPDGSGAPPPKTRSGKSTAGLREAVEREWANVAITDAAGKPAPIVVTLETDAGTFDMTLFPELAPNHVRNFLALAKVGYYDGLVFERTIRQEIMPETGPRQRVDIVTAGCPAGDGEPGHGHLGYFLRPEANSIKHEAGTVGFIREDDPNSACCRFYICLTPTPLLDGQLTAVGKVMRGLDIVQAIAARPVQNPAVYPENELPKEPVKIRAVTRR